MGNAPEKWKIGIKSIKQRKYEYLNAHISDSFLLWRF